MAQSLPVQDLRSDSAPESLAPRAATWARNAVREAHESVLKPAVEVLRGFKGGVRQPPVLVADGKKASSSGLNAAISPEANQALTAEVRLAQTGDLHAMSNLIESNRTWVRGIAYTVLGDAHLAEDAAQEVCVRVVKHLHGLDTPEAFRPWVYRMTRNVALSMAQRRERSPQPLSLDAEQMQDGSKMDRADMPSAALEEDERVSSILETIQKLPEIYREVLVLKHVQDLSYNEMSELLGVSVKSLEVRLVRARKLLQERLGRRFCRGRRRDPREDKE